MNCPYCIVGNYLSSLWAVPGTEGSLSARVAHAKIGQLLLLGSSYLHCITLSVNYQICRLVEEEKLCSAGEAWWEFSEEEALGKILHFAGI